MHFWIRANTTIYYHHHLVTLPPPYMTPPQLTASLQHSLTTTTEPHHYNTASTTTTGSTLSLHGRASLRIVYLMRQHPRACPDGSQLVQLVRFLEIPSHAHHTHAYYTHTHHSRPPSPPHSRPILIHHT